MGIITIDYDTLTLVAIMLFAAIGFFRGWFREGMTTIMLLVLAALLVKPELATPIIEFINQLLKLIISFFKGLLSLNLDQMLEMYKTMDDIFTPDNPYQFLLWATVFLLAMSYLAGKLFVGDGSLTPLSHLLGGLLGALNGFVVISLVKEFLLKYVDKIPLPTTADIAAQGGQGLEPNQMAIVMGGGGAAQTASSSEGYTLYLAIFLGLIIAALILGKIFNWGVGKQ